MDLDPSMYKDHKYIISIKSTCPICKREIERKYRIGPISLKEEEEFVKLFTEYGPCEDCNFFILTNGNFTRTWHN